MIQLTGVIREAERLAVIRYVICGARECSVRLCSGHISGRAPLVGHTQNCPIWLPRAKPVPPYISITVQKWTNVAQLQQFLWINTKPPDSLPTEAQPSPELTFWANAPHFHRGTVPGSEPMLRFHNSFREHLDIVRTRSKYLNNIAAPLLLDTDQD